MVVLFSVQEKFIEPGRKNIVKRAAGEFPSVNPPCKTIGFSGEAPVAQSNFTNILGLILGSGIIADLIAWTVAYWDNFDTVNSLKNNLQEELKNLNSFYSEFKNPELIKKGIDNLEKVSNPKGEMSFLKAVNDLRKDPTFDPNINFKLGSLYLNLADVSESNERENYLKLSIKKLEQSIKMNQNIQKKRTPELDEILFKTLANLGISKLLLSFMRNRKKYLTEAEKSFTKALDINFDKLERTDINDENLLKTRVNLSYAQLMLSRLENLNPKNPKLFDAKENLKQGILELQNIKNEKLNSEKNFDSEIISQEIAKAKTNLGAVYLEIARNTNPKENKVKLDNLLMACKYFNEAEKTFILSDVPFEYGMTSCNKAQTLFKISRLVNPQNYKDIKNQLVKYNSSENFKNIPPVYPGETPDRVLKKALLKRAEVLLQSSANIFHRDIKKKEGNEYYDFRQANYVQSTNDLSLINFELAKIESENLKYGQSTNDSVLKYYVEALKYCDESLINTDKKFFVMEYSKAMNNFGVIVHDIASGSFVNTNKSYFDKNEFKHPKLRQVVEKLNPGYSWENMMNPVLKNLELLKISKEAFEELTSVYDNPDYPQGRRMNNSNIENINKKIKEVYSNPYSVFYQTDKGTPMTTRESLPATFHLDLSE